MYRVRGPVRAQDGNCVWQVARRLDGTTRAVVVMECLRHATAVRECAELNEVIGEIEQRIERGLSPTFEKQDTRGTPAACEAGNKGLK